MNRELLATLATIVSDHTSLTTSLSLSQLQELAKTANLSQPATGALVQVLKDYLALESTIFKDAETYALAVADILKPGGFSGTLMNQLPEVANNVVPEILERKGTTETEEENLQSTSRHSLTSLRNYSKFLSNYGNMEINFQLSGSPLSSLYLRTFQHHY